MTENLPSTDRYRAYFADFADFAEKQPELARSLLDRVFSKADELNKAMRKGNISIVGTAIIFELLNRNLLGEASALGVKLSKLGFLRYFAPIVIMFLLFRCIVDARDQELYDRSARALCRNAYPEIEPSHILEVALTSGSALTNLNPPVKLAGVAASKIRSFIEEMEMVVVLLAIPIGFVSYAIIQLFRQAQSPHLGAVATLMTTLLLLTVTIVAVIGFLQEIEE